MSSEPIRRNSPLEVTNISAQGFWVFWNEREFFLDYDHFPWFKDARLSELINVRAESRSHLYWPDLDVDLNRSMIEDPDRYTLVARKAQQEPRDR